MAKSEKTSGTGRSGGWLVSGRWLGTLTVVAVVLAVVALNRPHGSFEAQTSADTPHADPSIPGTPVTMTYGECGAGWSGGTAGTQTFALWNSSGTGMEVYLEDAKTKKVYLDVESLGASSTRSASVTLGPGSYRFYCVPDDTTASYGQVVQVTGTTDQPVTPGLVPITANDLRPLMKSYEGWVTGQMPHFLAQVTALDRDVRAGDLGRARKDWFAAHHTYETLGAAYGAFGDYDVAIDGEPSTTTAARADKHLQGFHKIEVLLWPVRDAAPATAVAPYSRRLVRSAAALKRFFDSPVPHMSPIDVGLRAHEILEDAVLRTLTGEDDYGSHASLDTLDANITGTYHALDVLAPVLRTTDPDWAQTRRWLAKARTQVRSYDHHGRWVPLQRLTRAQREDLDATIGETVELLSRVAVMTDPRPAAG